MPNILPRQFQTDPEEARDLVYEGQLQLWPDPPAKPLEVHLRVCLDRWVDGQPARLQKPFACVCRDN